MISTGRFFNNSSQEHKQVLMGIPVDQPDHLPAMIAIASKYSDKIDPQDFSNLTQQSNLFDATQNIYKSLMTEQQTQASALRQEYLKLFEKSVCTIFAMAGIMSMAGAGWGFLGWALFVGGEAASASIPAVTIGAEVGGGLGTFLGAHTSRSYAKELFKSDSVTAYKTLQSDISEFKSHLDQFFAAAVQDSTAERIHVARP